MVEFAAAAEKAALPKDVFLPEATAFGERF
jgi:hypothetical protein